MEYVAKMDLGPINEQQLRENQFSALKLKELGYGVDHLKACGFDARELHEAGFNAVQLRCAGFSPAELRQGGLTVIEVHEAGFSHLRLIEAGFTAADLKDYLNLSLVELRQAGFKAGQLKAVGYIASELRAVGATAAEIKPYFTPGGKVTAFLTPLPSLTSFDMRTLFFVTPTEILRAGYPKDKLKPLGLWPHDGQWQHYNNYWSCCFSLDKTTTCCAATQPTGTETSSLRKASF
jgi:intracellular multiplication protein IcmE